MSQDQIEGTFRKGLGHVQDAAGGLIGDQATQAKGKINQAAGSVQDAYGRIVDQAQDAAAQAKDHAQGLYEDVETFVHDQPLLALGAAVGAGLVVGMLMRGGQKTVYARK